MAGEVLDLRVTPLALGADRAGVHATSAALYGGHLAMSLAIGCCEVDTVIVIVRHLFS